MTNNKITRPIQFILENENERATKDLKSLPKASGWDLNIQQKPTTQEVERMSEYIERKEFEQFEKRIDDRFIER